MREPYATYKLNQYGSYSISIPVVKNKTKQNKNKIKKNRKQVLITPKKFHVSVAIVLKLRTLLPHCGMYNRLSSFERQNTTRCSQ